MKFVRWDPFQELVPVPMSYRPNQTVDSFGPWAVDILASQEHKVETAKPKLIEMNPA